jgi:CelD/BcsL family acetyltransferase involved in cellulose biosynthesis
LELETKQRNFSQTLFTGDSVTPHRAINLLKLNERDIAAQLCMRRGSTISLLKIAFDQSLAKFSPGSVLLDMLLEQACADTSVQSVSLSTGLPWMQIWSPIRSEVADAWLFKRRLLARAFRIALNIRDRAHGHSSIEGK